MARRPKNPNVERVARIPFDKDSVSPLPQSARRAAGAGRAAPAKAAGTPPSTARSRPPAREEYPGPQTASSGMHVEPGQVRPAKPRPR
jgi:hypothetical protein